MKQNRTWELALSDTYIEDFIEDPKRDEKKETFGFELLTIASRSSKPREQIQHILFHLYPNPVNPETERLFRQLVLQWQKDTGGMSLMIQRAMHPAYQRIVGMGKDAIVLLLRELQNDPDDWFWALEAITGTRPTKPEDAGDLDAMAQSWIQWGIDNKYIV